MEFIGGVHVYMYYILCDLGFFIFKTNYVIELGLKTILNAPGNGYQHTFLLK